MSRHLSFAFATFALAMLAPASAGAQDGTLTLGEAVEAGLSVDPQTAAAQAARDAARAERDVAAAARGVQADTEVSAGVRRLENATRRNLGIADDVLFPLEGLVQADWTLADFGRTDAQVARAEALISAAESRIGGSREASAFAIAQEYVQVLLQQSAVEAASGNVASHQGLVALLRQSVEEGLVGLPEQQLAQQRLETARARLAEAEQALADARETLALLIAVPVPDNLAMPPDPAAQLDASASVETDRLAASSPAVLAAREDARAARLAADAAQADKKPTIGVDLQGRAGDDIDGFKGFTNDVRARVYVRLALTDGGARDARYRAALAQAREADARARATLRDVQVDIARTGNAWTTLGALEQANARELEATRGLLDSYSAQFEANRRSLLDVFEAQDMVLNAQIRLLNSRYSRLLAGYRALAAREALVDFLVAN